MKIKRENLAILLIGGLIFSILINHNFNTIDEQKTTSKNPKSSGGYTPTFIHIDASHPKNWSWTAGNYSWCYFKDGNYIIENVTINANNSPTGNGIFINNSKSEYFIIRNCTISNADHFFSDSGIKLENTHNGTIFNNTCLNNYQGIFLINCVGNTILENNASNNEVNGIYLEPNCDQNNITGNTANNNLFGIQLAYNCNYNNITLNTANENGDYGIYINGQLDQCDNNTILNNTVQKNDNYGIYIHTSDYTSIINNTANINKETGIFLVNSNNINVTYNTANNNDKYGIYVQNCDNSNITDNTVNSNLDIGLYIYYNSDSNEIRNNTINRNDLGISLDGSNYNNITGNTLKDNNFCIYESYCVGNIIEFNDCSSPTVDIPIYIDDYATGVDAHNWTWAESQTWCSGTGKAWDPYIIENLKISGFGTVEYGIDIRNSNVSFIIRECQIYNTDEAGIYFDNVNNSRLINNNCSNNDNGIYIEYSNSITIFENLVNYNDKDGIYLYESNYVNITGNFVNDNDDGIYISICNFSYINENTGLGNSGDGIYLEDSDYNTISENTFNENDRAGIFLQQSNHNDISKNFASDNIYNGIFLDNENNENIVAENTFKNNKYGIEIYDSDFNSITGNIVNDNSDIGIKVEASNNNTISGNTVSTNTNYGIFIATQCFNNTISGNIVSNHNITGVHLDDDSDYNHITQNIMKNNNLGLYLFDDCENNYIHRNFFLINEKHAIDDGADNEWNSTTIGNYWDNWTSPDTNDDGIVDNEYTYIGGSSDSIDHLPIAEDGAPQLTINSPSEGDVYSLIAPNFDVTITDDYLDMMWYTLDDGLNNYTFTENGIINQSAWDGLDDGTITLTFYASDIPGYIGSSSINIIKDTVAPVIIINSPAEGDRFGRTAPLFNVTFDDDNLDAKWYSFDGGLTTYTITNNTILNQTAWTALIQGEVTITFYARDLAGNQASESVTVIKSVPSGLDPVVIIIIVVVSVVGGVVVVSFVYFYMKKRKAV